jgi:Bacterial PH domain
VLSQQASSRKEPDSEREVFRSAGSTILSWAWFVVAVIVLVDLAVQGRDHAALVAAATVLAITGVVYSCAWRPRIVADSAGITLVNPVRDHQVPWAAVVKVDVVNAVRVHCAPALGVARGKILYSWAVQSSPRSARKAELRREASAQPRVRLTPRPRSAQPPPGAVPRYGEIPEPARDALDRSSAEFTAGRLEERAQHARQAAARMARLRSANGPAAATRPDDEQAGMSAGAAAPEARAATGSLTGDSPPAGAQAASAALPVAQWAWIPIAAMIAPVALLLLVALI